MPVANWMQFYSCSLSVSGWQKHTLSRVVFLSDSYPAGTAPISLQDGTLGSLLKFNITWGSRCSVLSFCSSLSFLAFPSKPWLIHTVLGSCSMLLWHSASQPRLLHYAMEPHLQTWCRHCAGPSAGAGHDHRQTSVWGTPSLGCLTKSKATEMQGALPAL